MNLASNNLHRQIAARLRETALDSGDAEILKTAMLRAEAHNLATRNPRAGRVMFRMLPGQSKGFTRMHQMFVQL